MLGYTARKRAMNYDSAGFLYALTIFAIFRTNLNQILDQNCSFLRTKQLNADISKKIRGTRHRFQNKNFKDIIFLCFKYHIGTLYQLGDTAQQSSCCFAHNVATFADVST